MCGYDLQAGIWVHLQVGSRPKRPIARLTLPGGPVPGEFTLVGVDTTEVTYIGHDAGGYARHVARWSVGEEYLRPSPTPAAVAPPRAGAATARPRRLSPNSHGSGSGSTAWPANAVG